MSKIGQNSVKKCRYLPLSCREWQVMGPNKVFYPYCQRWSGKSFMKIGYSEVPKPSYLPLLWPAEWKTPPPLLRQICRNCELSWQKWCFPFLWQNVMKCHEMRGPHTNLRDIPKNNDLFSMGPPNTNKRDCSTFDLFIAHIYVPDICDNVQECRFNFDKLLLYIFICT